MSIQQKNKLLLLIIGMLLITNIAMIVLLFTEKDGPGKRDKPDRRQYIMTYLEKEVGFNQAQLKEYDSLGTIHRNEIKQLFDSMARNRKVVLNELGTHSFSEPAMKVATEKITEQQSIVEYKMIQHLKAIRAICTAEQLPRFDTGFYKIVGKRQGVNGKK